MTMTKNIVCVGVLAALLLPVLSAGAKWITEPANSPMVKKIETAFGPGLKINVKQRTTVRAFKNLDVKKFAGKKVVLDAKFRFKIAPSGTASVHMEYNDASGKPVKVELRRHYYCGTDSLPWVRYAKQVTLPEKISNLKLVASMNNTNGELIVTGFRLLMEDEAAVENVKVPANWRDKFDSRFFSDGLHAYSRNGKLIFRFDVLDDSVFSATAAEHQAGFVPFLPDEVREVAPGRKIRRKEVLKKLSVRSTPGQGQELFIAVGALRPLKDVTVKVSDLKSRDGKVLPASIFDPRQAELMNIIWGRDYYRTIPKVQIPIRSTAIEPGCPKLYNLISELPADAVPGVYEGTVTIAADGKKVELPLTFEVLPFVLAKGKPYMFCYYHKPVLESFKWMRKYGANSVYLGQAQAGVALLPDGDVKLNMDHCDALIDCYRKSGMTEKMVFNPFHDRLASRVLELLKIQGRYKRLIAYGEPHYVVPEGQYPQEAKELYKKIIGKVMEHTEKAGYPDYLLHLMDEPAFPVDRTIDENNAWRYRGWFAKMEYGLAKEVNPSVKTFSTAYKLPTIELLRPELDVGCAEISRISRDDAVKYRQTVHKWGQPFWGMDWPAWWDDYIGTRRACGFLPADRLLEAFMIWVFYTPDTFDPDFEIADFCYGYQRTMYCYKDKDGNYCPTVVFEGIRAGANDWRFVETLREILAKMPEKERIAEEKALENVLKSEKIPLQKKRDFVIDKILKFKGFSKK